MSILAKSGVRVTGSAFPGEPGGSNGQEGTRVGKWEAWGPAKSLSGLSYPVYTVDEPLPALSNSSA